MQLLRLRCVSLLCGCLLAPLTQVNAAAWRVTVNAGDFDRRESVARIALPESGQEWVLHDGKGRTIPVQAGHEGSGVFIIQDLPKGATATYELRPTPSPLKKQVTATHEGRVVRLAVGEKLAFNYQAEKSELPRPDIKPAFRRGGYLHPVNTPSGVLVTDDYPRDHLHHHGIWFPWTKTEFEGRKPDFWNMGGGTGTVEFEKLEQTWSGPVHAGFRSRHRFVDLSAAPPTTVLNETWEVTLYRAGLGAEKFFMFDLVSTQTCATASPLKLPEYHYGGLGVRGHGDWNGATNAFFLTANGERNRVKGHATRANWCHMGGQSDGVPAGIAILGHPDNFRAPQPMRIHPKEPFFNFAPSQGGAWEISPGKPYVSRYRFIVADGAPNPALLDRLWNDYAHPASVTVSK